MMITVDPLELIAASETLRSCAGEAADIGSQLWACAQCPIPSELRGVVDQLVVATDRALDSVAAQLNAHAVDLANRALIAVNDSLSAALVTAGYGGPGSTLVTGSLLDNMVIGGTSTPDAVISGSQFDTMTIGGVSGVLTVGVSPPDSLFGGTMTIGGNSPLEITITSPDGTPVDDSTLFGPITVGVGAPNYAGTPMEGVMALAEAGELMRQRSQRTIDAIVSDPNSSPEMIRIALNAQTSLGNSVSHLIAPSRRELEDRYGYPLSDTEIRWRSPHTILDPVNIFDLS